MDSPHTFLVLGEALIDCVNRGGEVLEVPGGSPMNVAIGLGRLDQTVVLATRFGSDERGSGIAAHLSGSNVETIDAAPGLAHTSSATATIAADGSADYVFDLEWDLTQDMVSAGLWSHVHVGSIGATLEPGALGALAIIQREKALGASISYDPNARPAIMGTPGTVLPRIEAFVACSDLVKASDEDVEWLYPDLSHEQVVERWQELGAGVVMITRGASGVSAYARGIEVTLPTKATVVADTIGAGDSFMSGALAALAQRGYLGPTGQARWDTISATDLEAVVSFALDCAAITVSRSGAQPPTTSDVRGFSPS